LSRDFSSFTLIYNETVVNRSVAVSTQHDFGQHNYGDHGDSTELVDAVLDVLTLVRADYFVGTMSSNLGRLVYRLRTSFDPLRTPLNSVSLDLDFFQDGSVHPVVRVASAAHEAATPAELSFAVGDTISGVDVVSAYGNWVEGGEFSNLPDGISYGRHEGTAKVGLFPRWKTAIHVRRMMDGK